jgi:hypothetical protein
MDLFTPVVAEDRLHHNFLATIKPNAAGVREVLTGWGDGFVGYEQKDDRWWITDKAGKVHWLAIEAALA